jgi:hypothetical protein
MKNETMNQRVPPRIRAILSHNGCGARDRQSAGDQTDGSANWELAFSVFRY